MGSLKLNQQINKEMHREIRRNFVQYSKVFPLANTLGIKVSAKLFRLVIGWIELVSGLVLAFIPGRVKQIANFLLICITFGGIYTHFMIGDKFERIAPSIVFTLMLCCRLIVHYQVKRRETKELISVSENEKKEN